MKENIDIKVVPSKVNNIFTLTKGYFDDKKYLDQQIFTDGNINELKKGEKQYDIESCYVNSQKILTDKLFIKKVMIRNASYVIKVTYERILDCEIITDVETYIIGKTTKNAYLNLRESYIKNVMNDKRYRKKCVKNPFSIIEMFKNDNDYENKGISYVLKK